MNRPSNLLHGVAHGVVQEQDKRLGIRWHKANKIKLVKKISD